MPKNFLLLLLLLFSTGPSYAQSEKKWIKHQIATLSGPSMQGRGYVNKGVDKAANYLKRKFRDFGLRPLDPDSSYFQSYNFPVNTFPGEILLKLQRKELNPGADFIVHPASVAYCTRKIKAKTVDFRKVKDSTSWEKVRKDFKHHFSYILKNTDTVFKYLQLNQSSLCKQLPPGLFVIPQHGKLTWSVARETMPASVFFVEDTVMPRRIRKIAARLDNSFIPGYKNNNVIGYVPGTERPDSFILFTAHFDHLGRMGKHVLFPGAHDNASGTALMLYLANFFSENPQKYSLAFIGFSGEEAGLMGSGYYTEHPFFPLEKIRMVINLDMTGDVKNGVTVVNATEQRDAFSLLNRINDAKSYLPKINERGQTRNSDHYPFSEKKVPAIFIYGNGTKPFYHDIFDTSKELSLENIDRLVHLLIDFVGRY